MGSLTEEQSSVVVGTLLGDGYMRCKNNAHLQITHSLKQKKLVIWKYNKLKNLVRTKPTYYFNNGRNCYRFFTRSLESLTPFYKQFYKKGVKIIPKDLSLDNLALAVWFMDDGSKSYNTVYLNSQQFSVEQQNRLIKFLKNNFGIESTLNKDKEYFRIRIRVKSIGTFINLVKPFVIPSLKYKLPL